MVASAQVLTVASVDENGYPRPVAMVKIKDEDGAIYVSTGTSSVKIALDALTTLWETSVRATHHFLTDDDIQKLIPFVKMGVSGIETLIVASDDNHAPIAFMGVEASKIEMLFVSPDYFSKGLGRRLAELAISQYGVQYVDVNEQNPQAIGFYEHIGFEVFERTEFDEQGNPFPILKMKLR